MTSHRLNLMLAIERARAAGFNVFADTLAALLRREPRIVYGVLHPMRADRTAFSSVETPKLRVA